LNRLLIAVCMVGLVALLGMVYLWWGSKQQLVVLQVQMEDKTATLQKQLSKKEQECTSPWDNDLVGTPRPCGKKWRRWCQQGCTSGALEVAPDWMKK